MTWLHKRTLLLLFLVLSASSSSEAQGLMAWWKPLTGFTGGQLWYNRISSDHLTLTNVAFAGTTSGWTSPTQSFTRAEVRFDGSDDYGTVTAPTLETPHRSVLLWVKFLADAATDYRTIFQWRTSDGSANGFALYAKTSLNLAFYYKTTGGADQNVDPLTSGFSLNVWTHFAATYDSLQGLIVYKNCSSIGTDAATGTVLALNRPFEIAGSVTAGLNANVVMNDIKIYDRALSQQEVCTAMVNDMTAQDTALDVSKSLAALAVKNDSLLPYFFPQGAQ
jgi:hypothetical protein